MANEIGWGAAFSEENGYGMAAVNGEESGYGNILITSYSGETNISSIDVDNPIDEEISILTELPVIYAEGIDINLYFLLNTAVTPLFMSYTVFKDGRRYSDGELFTDGLQYIISADGPGEWYVDVIIYTSDMDYTFTSNTITI